MIEGFYGPPWPATERRELLAWLGDHGFDTYVHAPKHDPYQRLRWRTPCPADRLAMMAEEVAHARAHGVEWIPSISPGLPFLDPDADRDPDVCFADPADLDVLVAKLHPFWAMGVRTLMVSFDDVGKRSSHAADTERFGEGDEAYGRMNAHLLNAVHAHYRALDPSAALIAVPADYHGTDATPYLSALGEALDPEIELMWTGPHVVSPTISAADTEAFAAATGRRPLVWDNSHVNDFAPHKLMVGPYAGRSADLAAAVSGIVVNPSPHARLNRIGLATVAEYVRDPVGYDPEAAWDRAVYEVCGGDPDQRSMLEPLLTNVRSTVMDRTECTLLEPLLDAFLTALAGGGRSEREAAAEPLVAELRREVECPGRLRAGFHDQALVAELDRVLAILSFDPTPVGSWLDRLAANATLAMAAVDAALGRPGAPDAAGLRAEAERVASGNPAVTHGDRHLWAIGPTFTGESHIDRLVAAVADHLETSG